MGLSLGDAAGACRGWGVSRVLRSPSRESGDELCAEADQPLLAGRPEDSALFPNGVPNLRPSTRVVCPSWDEIQRQENASRADSDPIATAPKAADAKLVPARDLRLLDGLGDKVALVVEEDFAVWAFPKRIVGTWNASGAHGSWLGPSVDQDASSGVTGSLASGGALGPFAPRAEWLSANHAYGCAAWVLRYGVPGRASGV